MPIGRLKSFVLRFEVEQALIDSYALADAIVIPSDEMYTSASLNDAIAKATAMYSGKSFIFRSGVFVQVMRSSMAIPAVFTPVRKDSMVLIDGGTVDNYPVDVAKEMGADYIIGIDVQNDKRNADELSNAKTFFSN